LVLIVVFAVFKFVQKKKREKYYDWFASQKCRM
jgi:hypothetical protein